jgi:hypothetical protein
LIGAGLTSAAASVVFAAAMVSRGDHQPLVNGMQYLAIFAQPSGRTAPSAPTATTKFATLGASPGSARTDAGASIDFNPTGSIPRVVAEEPAQSDPYRLVAVEPGMAWLRNGAEMRVVKPGDVAPGLGRIAAIVKRDGRWALVGDSGVALLVADPPPSVAPAEDRFARGMIFGTDN